MAQKPAIKYAIHKSSTSGLFLLGFDNLTKAEAAEYLLLLARQQDARAEPVVDDGKAFATTEEVAAALGVDPFAKRSNLRPALGCEKRDR